MRFGEADRWWEEAAAILAPMAHELRNWLTSSFFDHHLNTTLRAGERPHLVAARRPSGRYSVWLCPTAYARQFLSNSERRSDTQARPRGASAHGPNAECRCQSIGQGAQGYRRSGVLRWGASLLSRRGEARCASMEPVLDDGVVLTMAPLWRLIPQHKPWQESSRASGMSSQPENMTGPSRRSFVARAGNPEMRDRPKPRHRPPALKTSFGRRRRMGSGRRALRRRLS